MYLNCQAVFCTIRSIYKLISDYKIFSSELIPWQVQSVVGVGQGCSDPGCSVGQTGELQHTQGPELLLQKARHDADHGGEDVVQAH